MAQVVIENLTKVFPVRSGAPVQAVRGVQLVVADREFLVLAGPSGCGKSTLLRLLAGLEEPTAGQISLDGKLLNGVPPKDRNLAMVFQSSALYPHLTAYENLAFGLRLRHLAHPDIDRRVRDAAALLEIQDCLTRLPRDLSGGQRQRVALGRALVRQPAIYLFDEPLSNLDTALRSQLRREIVALHQRLSTTMIYVTHDQVEAMTMGNRLAVMRDGAIQQVAEPMQLFRQPANQFVAGFLGTPPMNFFRGRLTAHNGTVGFAEEIATPSVPSGAPSKPFTVELPEAVAARFARAGSGRILLGLRPEFLGPACAHGELHKRKTVDALVESVAHLGSETHLHLRTAAHSFVARVPATVTLSPGILIPCSFDLTHAHCFDASSGVAIE